MLHWKIFLISKHASSQLGHTLIHTWHILSKAHTNICGKSFFTRGNISTNVDTLLKGTHITIKWNKEGEYSTCNPFIL